MTGAGAGDVDADGYDDLLLGALVNDEGGDDAGAAYLVLGPVTGSFDLSSADAKLVGEDYQDVAGSDVSSAGDVDNDGHADLLIGAIFANAAYLVSSPVSGTVDLSMADAKLVAGYYTGASVAGAGDVDGDGFGDLLVGSGFDLNTGAVHVVLGPVTGTVDISLTDARLVGQERGDSASHVAGAGDVDADGRPDILVGGPGNDEGGSNAGAAYLVYGGGLF
jgi:hypothetical protein